MYGTTRGMSRTKKMAAIARKKPLKKRFMNDPSTIEEPDMTQEYNQQSLDYLHQSQKKSMFLDSSASLGNLLGWSVRIKMIALSEEIRSCILPEY
jgi:hypothetical protein